MKHWDLTPGETVRLCRGEFEVWDARGRVEATFRFRTTVVAVFENDKDAFELDLLPDGSLKDATGTVWQLVGRDRDTRTIITEPLGEGRTFTRTERTLARAARGGA